MKQRVGGGRRRRGGGVMLKGREGRSEAYMHYTPFPFTLPYNLPHAIGCSVHSGGVLTDAVVGCGVRRLLLW